MLLILSHVQHTCRGGKLYAYGPYAREIEEWAELFSQVAIAAPCRKEVPPGDALAFSHRNIAVAPMPEFSGGRGSGRLRDAVVLPGCVLRLCRLLWQADAVHVRCPGSIGLLGLLLAPAVFRVKRMVRKGVSRTLNVQRPTSNVQRPTSKCQFPPDNPFLTPETRHPLPDTRNSLPLIAKYAGQWNGYPGEAWTYRLQRWLLKSRWWGAPVTVYGEWPNQPRHVIPFFTSVLTEQQMAMARESAERKAEIAKAESRNWESQEQSEPQTEQLTSRQPRSAGGECAEHGAGSAEAEYQSPKRSAGGGGSKATPSLSAAAAFVPGSVGCLDSGSDSDSGLCSQAAPDIRAPNAVRGVEAATTERGGQLSEPQTQCGGSSQCAPSLSAATACVPGSAGYSDSELRVLFVGRLSRAKHVDVLLEALAELRDQGLAFSLTIAGDGSERKPIEELSKALKMQAQVRLAGGLPFGQVLGCYREHDVLVLASETEGWPKAIAEAMAFGLICIGSNRSIIPQMLGDGRGFLVEPGDRVGLIARLRQMAAMPANERAEMSRRAAEWGQRYTLENLREALGKLMEEWWGESTCNNSMAG